jgi:hypothetical protein
MRYLLLTIIFSIIFYLPGGAFSISNSITIPVMDTLPPPPPPGPVSNITGPASACVGEISEYFIEVPVACTCQWSLDGILQPGSGSTFSIMWTQAGIHEISVVFSCSEGMMSDPVYKTVEIWYEPEVFLGNDTLIIQGQTLMLDAGNPGLEHLWSTGETTQTITVSFAGEYSVTVTGYCGSDSDTIEVFVAIGIEEYSGPDDCFTISSRPGKILVTGIPENADKIQFVTSTGRLLYEGKPMEEIAVYNQGIYLIRMISTDGTCIKKVFVP